MGVGLSIGQLAKAAGVNIETIRYYQRRGLLIEPTKPLGGYRRYPEEMVKRLHFIKRAQALGFTLLEVEGLLVLDESCACSSTRALAAHKLKSIKKKIDDLAAMRDALDRLIQQCDEGSGKAGCPIINALGRD